VSICQRFAGACVGIHHRAAAAARHRAAPSGFAGPIERVHALASAFSAEALLEKEFVVLARPVRERRPCPRAQVPDVPHGLHRDAMLGGKDGRGAVSRVVVGLRKEDGQRRCFVQR